MGTRHTPLSVDYSASFMMLICVSEMCSVYVGSVRVICKPVTVTSVTYHVPLLG
jgi:hypothetical protein